MYKDTKPQKSSLLVFNRVYRLEIQSIILVFSTPLVNYSAPLTFSLVHLPPPLSCVNKYKDTCIHTVCNGGGVGWGDWGPQTNTCRQVPLLVNFLEKPHLGFGVFIDIGSMILAIYAPMIYTTAPYVMCTMRADPIRGQVGGDWALEIETFLGPVKWHWAVRWVPFGALKLTCVYLHLRGLKATPLRPGTDLYAPPPV